jgi:hypothetical protein
MTHVIFRATLSTTRASSSTGSCPLLEVDCSHRASRLATVDLLETEISASTTADRPHPTPASPCLGETPKSHDACAFFAQRDADHAGLWQRDADHAGLWQTGRRSRGSLATGRRSRGSLATGRGLHGSQMGTADLIGGSNITSIAVRRAASARRGACWFPQRGGSAARVRHPRSPRTSHLESRRPARVRSTVARSGPR